MITTKQADKETGVITLDLVKNQGKLNLVYS